MFRKGDRVYCVLNKSIKGEVISRNNYHGKWLYHIRPDNEESFRKRTSLNSMNTPFLHWQLEKILKGGQ